MPSKEKNTIRFAVGDKNDVHSSVWRLWSEGNDLYLTARSHVQISKISFHQSGINRYAINEKVERENPAADRALYKWKRPDEFIPGWTRCLGILIPPRITQMPFGNIFDKDKAIEFVNPPQEDQKVIFNILISHKAVQPEHVIHGSVHNITIHGCIQMPRELAWLVSFYDGYTTAEDTINRDRFNKLKIHLKPGSTSEGIRNAFLHVLEEGIMPFLIDTELGKENLDIPSAIK